MRFLHLRARGKWIFAFIIYDRHVPHDSLWAMAKLFGRSLSQLWFVVTSYFLPEWGMALSHFKVWGYLEGGDAGDEEVIYVR